MRISLKNLPSAGKYWSIASIAQLLAAHPALTTLTTHHAVILAQRMCLLEAAQGAVIFKAGDTNTNTNTNFLALVLEGRALEEAQVPKANEAVALKIINPGDALGELGFIANIPHSATVTASTDLTVAILDQSAFAQLIEDVPDFACAFLSTLLQSLAIRLRDSNRKLQTMTETTQSMYAELATSRNSEHYLANLFASNSNVVTPLTETEHAKLPKTKNPGIFTR